MICSFQSLAVCWCLALYQCCFCIVFNRILPVNPWFFLFFHAQALLFVRYAYFPTKPKPKDAMPTSQPQTLQAPRGLRGGPRLCEEVAGGEGQRQAAEDFRESIDIVESFFFFLGGGCFEERFGWDGYGEFSNFQKCTVFGHVFGGAIWMICSCLGLSKLTCYYVLVIYV